MSQTELEKQNAELLLALRDIMIEVDAMAVRCGWSGYGARVRAREAIAAANASQAQSAPAGAPDCGSCPGDGSVCVASCVLAEESPRAPAANAGVLEPVEGDLLPPIGSKVKIHLARQDEWVEHTVTGYYVWKAHPHQIKPGEQNAHRVFVRVKDAQGYDNARLLSEVRAAAEKAGGLNEHQREFVAAVQKHIEAERCTSCDGTGDMHRPDGEWLGECTACDANKAPAADADALVRDAARYRWLRQRDYLAASGLVDLLWDDRLDSAIDAARAAAVGAGGQS